MESTELLNVMEKIGHFLYHRRGGKRGLMRMLRILREKEACSQCELLEILNIRAASLSELAAKTEQKGYIIREKSEEDKRKVVLKITPEGRQWLQEKENETARQEVNMFDCLTEAEQQELFRLLNKLLECWQERFDSALFRHRSRCKGDKNNV
ncbi:MAG: MarR family transcriptional regulator [Eubacterium sp.]|nr:MarR family transcriptional regulator [Eubacterium sp.]